MEILRSEQQLLFLEQQNLELRAFVIPRGAEIFNRSLERRGNGVRVTNENNIQTHMFSPENHIESMKARLPDVSRELRKVKQSADERSSLIESMRLSSANTAATSASFIERLTRS